MRKYLLKDCINKKGLTMSEFCQLAKISYSKLSKQMNGKLGVSTDDVVNYVNILDIRNDPKLITDIFLELQSRKQDDIDK